MTLQERYDVKTSLITIYKRLDEIIENEYYDDIGIETKKKMKDLHQDLKKCLKR